MKFCSYLTNLIDYHVVRILKFSQWCHNSRYASVSICLGSVFLPLFRWPLDQMKTRKFLLFLPMKEETWEYGDFTDWAPSFSISTAPPEGVLLGQPFRLKQDSSRVANIVYLMFIFDLMCLNHSSSFTGIVPAESHHLLVVNFRRMKTIHINFATDICTSIHIVTNAL